MALYAFDGTWNSAKETDDAQYTNTNVFRFYQAYHARSKTDDLYVAGVGTRFDLVGKVIGGVFGMGELPRIDEAYDHLCRTWASGDETIDIVGFSRGAATTLDFCHRIQEDGVRRPNSDDVVEKRPRIRFLGVWDVVAAFGLANLGATDLNLGHHLSLPKASLQYRFHALALDERRPSFLPTRLQGAYEVWFRGVHSDVGGGNQNRGLNDIALKWMMQKARGAGLPVTEGDVSALKPNPMALPHSAQNLPLNVRVISGVDRRHYTVSPLEGWATPPDTCLVETPEDEQRAAEMGAETLEVLPLEVRRRVLALWETAEAVGTQLDFPIAGVKDTLLTLFQGRVPLIRNDEDLQRGRKGTARLVETMVHNARTRGWHTMAEFFLTEALFQCRPLFPFTG